MLTAIASLIAGGGGATAIQALARRRNTRAEAQKVEAEGAQVMSAAWEPVVTVYREQVQDLTDRIDKLEVDRDRLEEENRQCRVRAAQCETQHEEAIGRIGHLELQLSEIAQVLAERRRQVIGVAPDLDVTETPDLPRIPTQPVKIPDGKKG